VRFLFRGHGEQFKATVHTAGAGLFAVMGLYNATAFVARTLRHEPDTTALGRARANQHLAFCAVLDVAIALWETHLADQHHRRTLTEDRPCD
jgi:hypothetical protein